MKLVRILVYEGSEDAIDRHVKQMFVGPDRPFAVKGDLKITEVFRGRMADALVEHLNGVTLTELSAAEMDKDVIAVGFEEEGPVKR